MNALRVFTVIGLRPAAKAAMSSHRRAAGKPVWRVSSDTGRRERIRTGASASDLPASRAA